MSMFKLVKVGMGVFGEAFANGVANGFEPNNSPYVPDVKPSYRFDNIDAMRIMSMSWGREWSRSDELHRKGVMFFGPTGSGKSSFVEQFFARLNVPLLQVTWNPKRTADEMLTDRVLIDGMLLDRDQAIVIAARLGVPVLINEIDLADPSELVALNDVIEAGLITLPNGEKIKAKRGFVVYATSNTAGVEDEDGVYAGTRSQNASTLRRFFKCGLGYPSLDEEIAFLKSHSSDPVVYDSMIRNMASVIVMVRQAFEGTSDKHRLSKPISRPEAVDWLHAIQNFTYLRSGGKGMTVSEIASYALGFTFSNGMPSSDRKVLDLMIEESFSDFDFLVKP